MNCQEWTNEIIERARTGEALSPFLTSHLAACPACRDDWEAQLALSGELARLREAAGRRSPEFNRARLMNDYTRIYGRATSGRRFQWVFAAAAAAVVLLAVALSWRTETPAAARASEAAMRWQEASPGEEFEDLSGEGAFVAVPYAAPLAKGEFVRVVRTELYAAALDRMGVSVPTTNGEFPAEVVVGEDGLPRAVRVLAQY